MPPRFRSRRKRSGTSHRLRRLRRFGGRRSFRRRSYRGGRTRKVFRRIRRFKKSQGRRRFKGTRKTFAKKVLKSLQPALPAVCRYGQENTVSPATGSATIEYVTTEVFDGTVGINKDTCVNRVLLDVQHIPKLADLVWANKPTAAANINTSSNQTALTQSIETKLLISGKVVYRMRNQSNEPIFVTAYVCKVRRDYRYAQGNGTNNIYGLLSRGFATAGKDSANITADANLGMYDQDYTPYNSPIFCAFAKILKKKRFKIVPGAQHFESLKMKEKWVNPLDYVVIEGTTNGTNSWAQWTKKYDFSRHARFILFRLESNPAGYGAAQSQYSKQITHTTPTIVMDTSMQYKVRAAENKTAGCVDLEFAGYAAGGVGNTIVTYNNPVLTTEQEAV